MNHFRSGNMTFRYRNIYVIPDYLSVKYHYPADISARRMSVNPI